MTYDQKQTELWINQIKQGDEQAFNDFYHAWYPKAFYIALSITHHEADAKDAAQETMIQVHKSIRNLRDINYFKLWFNRIVLSKCNRIFRKRKEVTMTAQHSETINYVEENRMDHLPFENIRTKSDLSIFHQMIMNLPPIYSHVMILMYLEQLNVSEISKILEIPEGTVKSRCHKGKVLLRNEINEYETREGIKLDFHALTWEAILASGVCKALEKTAVISNTTFTHHFSHALTTWLHSKAVILACASALILTTGAVIYQNHQEDQENQARESLTKTMTSTKKEFPTYQFKGMEIHSEKEAYFILMKYAHCEKEMAQLSGTEQTVIKQMVDSLNYQNSTYMKLWLQKK